MPYFPGLSRATAGSHAICMKVASLPPGARAQAHLHRGVETAAYVIEGEAEVRFGARLEERVRVASGEYVYIAADTPHVVWNPSDLPCTALVAHTAPEEDAGIVLLPELDALL
jgi:uncharacterized RmlC-like cupin family protein